MPIQGLEDLLQGADPAARIVAYLCAQFRDTHGVDLTNDDLALRRVREAAAAAAEALRDRPSHEVHVPFITATHSGPLHLTATVTRDVLTR